MRIAVIDYGMGNLRSVERALLSVAPEAEVLCTSNAELIASADAVVFPGQGSFAACMKALRSQGLVEVVRYAALHLPFLGICVGLQLLFEHSEEGDVEGLGVLSGRVVRFPQSGAFALGGAHLKVPHMGWNTIRVERPTEILSEEFSGAHFYFVHSYYVVCDEALQVASCRYGVTFTAAVAMGRLFASQFHPEKSGAKGLELLARFVAQVRR